jgi:glucose-1-phosphate cytidylyltransferase
MKSKKLKNKMIILCGGRGKRMGKITDTIPKPLIKIKNKPIIEHKIRYYKTQGVQNFIFCLGYKSRQLKKFLLKKTINSIYHDAGLHAGILKRIFLVKENITDNTIISYGDTLAKINFKDLIKKHESSKCLMTIVAAPIQNPFGLINWDQKGKVVDFKEKPILNHFIGYSVINPNFFNKVNKRIMNLKNGKGIIEAIKYLIRIKQVNIYKFNKLQITIISQDELKYAKLNYKKYFTL